MLRHLRYHRSRAVDLLRRGRNIVHSRPAVSGLADANKVAANFLCSLDRHGVTSGVIFETANDDPNHFAFHVQQRSASLAALGRSVHAQMDGGKIAAKTFPVESNNPAEVR